MGLDPDKYFETLALLGFLTPSASFPSCFDPGAGAGKLPALRAVVTGQAALVTPAFYPAILSSPRILCLLLGMISEPMPQHPATNGSQRPFGVWGCWEFSSMAGGPQIGSQGLTRRFVLQGGIWQRPVPVFGVAAGGKYPQPNGWGESCRDCCLSTSFHAYQNNCLVPQ